MKPITAIVLVALLAGCAQRTYVKRPDGTVELRSSTLFVGSKVSAVSVTSNGLRVGSAEQIGDSAMVQAVAAGVVAGMRSSQGIP